MAKRKLGRPAKSKTIMDKNKVYKYIWMPCVIVIIASLIFLIWYNNNQNSTYRNVQYIRSFMTSSGKLNDFQNKLGMHDPATDIKWYKTEDEIRIEFGRIFMTWEPEDFYTAENLELISTIGFTIDIKEEDGMKVLHLYWNDKEVERWIK